MLHAVQPLALLVVAFDDVPGRFLDRGALEHLFLRFGILFPADTGLEIHR